MNSKLAKYCLATRARRTRKGSLLTEAIVSAVILLVGISLVGKSSYNFRRLWSDTRCYQLATDELSNQMQVLTNLPKDQIATTLSSLTVSPEIAKILPNAKIDAQLIEDANGLRIRLAMDWKRVGTGDPLILIGWHRGTSKAVGSASKSTPDASAEATQ